MSPNEYSYKQQKKLRRLTSNLVKMLDGMTKEQKEDFVLNLKNNLDMVEFELKQIERQMHYLKYGQTYYIPERKKKLISCCIELSCCVVGGVLAGLSGLNPLFGVAYGFLVSVPLDMLAQMNMETNFLKRVIVKLKLKLCEIKKGKLKNEKENMELKLNIANNLEKGNSQLNEVRPRAVICACIN